MAIVRPEGNRTRDLPVLAQFLSQLRHFIPPSRIGIRTFYEGNI